MDIQSIYTLIEDDMADVDVMIHARLQSDVALINQLGHYIINSGGKRLRPALVILSARACGYEGRNYANLATIIEFIHTATLLHDDVSIPSSHIYPHPDIATTPSTPFMAICPLQCEKMLSTINNQERNPGC